MEREITIDGRAVRFRASAAIPRLYRIKFKRDILVDMHRLQAALEKAQEAGDGLPLELLEVFENIAYMMARHADPDMVAHTVEDWLDTFETFSVYGVFPEIFALWSDNLEGLADAKKNKGRPPGK